MFSKFTLRFDSSSIRASFVGFVWKTRTGDAPRHISRGGGLRSLAPAFLLPFTYAVFGNCSVNDRAHRYTGFRIRINTIITEFGC